MNKDDVISISFGIIAILLFSISMYAIAMDSTKEYNMKVSQCVADGYKQYLCEAWLD